MSHSSVTIQPPTSAYGRIISLDSR